MARPGKWCGVWGLSLWLSGLLGLSVLHAESQEVGWVRVIVQLRVATSDSRPSEEVTRQQDTVTQAKEALLRELPVRSYRVLRMYETIPFVALEVAPEALQVLGKSRWVVSLEADALAAPHPQRTPQH